MYVHNDNPPQIHKYLQVRATKQTTTKLGETRFIKSYEE